LALELPSLVAITQQHHERFEVIRFEKQLQQLAWHLRVQQLVDCGLKIAME
jgi:hypothetical protein